VVTDAERLRSALVNVLVNACQAIQTRAKGSGAPDGTAALEPPLAGHDIELTTAFTPGGRLAITVRDRGVGIPAQELARVSEPYFTTKRGGTGLGLAISRNIVEGLGGAITVSSQAGVGTEVRIELPLTAAARNAGDS
jgi:signal transduction histidine kinase